jgi:hypothetical protein
MGLAATASPSPPPTLAYSYLNLSSYKTFFWLIVPFRDIRQSGSSKLYLLAIGAGTMPIELCAPIR